MDILKTIEGQVLALQKYEPKKEQIEAKIQLEEFLELDTLIICRLVLFSGRDCVAVGKDKKEAREAALALIPVQSETMQALLAANIPTIRRVHLERKKAKFLEMADSDSEELAEKPVLKKAPKKKRNF